MIKTSDFKDIKKMKKQATMGENLCKKKKKCGRTNIQNTERTLKTQQKTVLKLDKRSEQSFHQRKIYKWQVCRASMLKIKIIFIRKMLIKAIMRCHYTHIKTTKIKKPDNFKCW